MESISKAEVVYPTMDSAYTVIICATKEETLQTIVKVYELYPLNSDHSTSHYALKSNVY